MEPWWALEASFKHSEILQTLNFWAVVQAYGNIIVLVAYCYFKIKLCSHMNLKLNMIYSGVKTQTQKEDSVQVHSSRLLRCPPHISNVSQSPKLMICIEKGHIGQMDFSCLALLGFFSFCNDLHTFTILQIRCSVSWNCLVTEAEQSRCMHSSMSWFMLSDKSCLPTSLYTVMAIWLYYLSDIFFNWLPCVNSYIFLAYVCSLICVFPFVLITLFTMMCPADSCDNEPATR